MRVSFPDGRADPAVYRGHCRRLDWGALPEEVPGADYLGGDVSAVGLVYQQFLWSFGIYLIPAEVGIPLTMLLVVFITNAINLIDGIDGLASGLSMVALLVFGVLFVHFQMWSYAMLAFVTVGGDYPVLFVQRVRQCGFGKEDFHGGIPATFDSGVYSVLLCHQVLYV